MDFDAAEVCYFISNKLREKGVDIWLEYGSALGAIRDGGVAEGDDDIDMGMWLKDWKILEEILQNDMPFSTSYKFVGCYSGGGYLVITGETPFRVGKREGKIDIWAFDLNDTHGWGQKIRSGPSNYKRAFRTKAYYQENLKTIQFEGFEFLISKYAEKCLDYLYKDVGGMGSDWRTKVVTCRELNNWEEDVKAYAERDKITGYTEGVFDLCHKGHIRLFRRMRDIFDKVVVAVTPDEIVKTYKETPIFPYEERVEIVEACKYVDEVILPAEGSITTIDWMEANNIDYVVHGKTDVKFLKKWYSEPMKERRLFLLGETKGYHTEDIKKRIKNDS
jgi:cytidyltransferase-like protein